MHALRTLLGRHCSYCCESSDVWNVSAQTELLTRLRGFSKILSARAAHRMWQQQKCRQVPFPHYDVEMSTAVSIDSLLVCVLHQ